VNGMGTMVVTERRPLEARGQSEAEAEPVAKRRVWLLFLVVILGVFGKWAFEIVGAYIDDSSAAPTFPKAGEIIARAIFAVLVSAIIFPTIYSKIDTATGESRVTYFIAFQNGFFWQSLFDSVTGDFATPAGG
jgi:hypothetical protein